MEALDAFLAVDRSFQRVRPWLPVVFLAGAIALAIWLIPAAPSGASGTFPVDVVGPDGVIFTGNVTAQDATAFTVLLAASEAGGFDVDSTGRGADRFVTAIDGHHNDGAAGWCYDVWDDGWTRPAVGAGAYGLEPGQATRWRYEAEGCGALA